VNATFYIWPIGCSLFAQNITADVRGDNVLLRKTAHALPQNPTPFLRDDIPHDPLEFYWGYMIFDIYHAESGLLSLLSPLSPEGPSQFLTPLELLLGSGLNSTNDSLALLSDRLSSMTALFYTDLIQTYCNTPSSGPQVYFGQECSPVFATVSGSQSIVVAGLIVHLLPLIIGIITCSILIFIFVATAGQSTSSDNVIQDGKVINMVSLLHNSSLPTVIANGNEDLQRIQAIHTHVL
jgi:hypothetical protein